MSFYYEKILATGEVKCIDEEVPFNVPQGWEWERFGNVMINKDSERVPLSVAQRQHLKKTYDYYGASGVIDKVDKYLFDKDLLLIGEDGANLINRSTPIAFIAKGKFWVNNHAHVLDVCCGMALSYVALFINAISLVDYVTGTAQPKMNQEKMNSILLAIPPVKEQHRILEKMSMVDAFIDKYASLQIKLNSLDNSVYELLRKSILQEAIQGKLVPQITEEGAAQELLEQIKAEKQELVKEGKLKKSALATSVIFRSGDNRYYEQIGKKCVDITEEIPFSIPANWTWVRIRDVFRLNPKNEADDDSMAAFIPMEKISAGYKSDFVFDTVKWGSIKKGFTHFANGDVAFAKITPCFQNRKSAIFHGLPNGIGAGTTELKVLRPYGNTIGRWYLLYFLESPYFIDEATFKGTANQQRIVVGYLENKLFPLPPKEEQQRIVAQIEKLFEQLR